MLTLPHLLSPRRITQRGNIAHRLIRRLVSMSKDDSNAAQSAAQDDDEPDEWDKRIFSTGCADENAKLTDCYYEKKDWRLCTQEMATFKECWKKHNNDNRTSTKDA